jgi:hypothetical protein
VTPEEIVDRLSRVARAASGDRLTPREQEGLQRLEQALVRRRAPRRWQRSALLVGLTAVLVASCLSLIFRARSLTFVVIHGHAAEGGYIVADGEATAVRFSDQSELAMAAGTRMRVSRLEPRGARLMLEAGLLHVHIRPRPRASWAIDAGPYVVHVTGTEFDLAWRSDEQTLDLDLRRGSVTVDGPLAGGELQMIAGQHLVAHAREGSLTILDGAAQPAAPAPPPQPSPVAETDAPRPRELAEAGATVAPPVPPASPAPRAGTTGLRWTAHLARADFDGILAEADQIGIDRVLAEAPLADLAALADAARYARRPEVAGRALRAERARFAGSAPAHDAAFFLGGLAEGRSDDAAALEWYETYLRESAAGAYAAQALGRKLLLVQRLEGIDRARPLAHEYLERFGDGAYAPYARKLLQAR